MVQGCQFAYRGSRGRESLGGFDGKELHMTREAIIFRRSWLELFDVVTALDIAEILANAAGRKAIDYLSLYPIRWTSYRPHDDLAREQAQRGDWYEATGPADRQEHVNLIWRLASRVRVGILLDDGLAHPAKAEDGGKLVVE